MIQRTSRRISGKFSVFAFGRGARRGALLAGLSLLVAGCAGGGYGHMRDGGFGIPPVDLTSVDSDLLRQEVAWKGKEKPGKWKEKNPAQAEPPAKKGGPKGDAPKADAGGDKPIRTAVCREQSCWKRSTVG